MTTLSPLAQLISTWRAHPDAFVEQWFGVTLEPFQRTILKALPTHFKMAIRSAKGCGKTGLVAWIAIWYLVTHYGSTKVILTSPSAGQLERGLMPELKHWIGKARPEFLDLFTLTVLSDEIRSGNNFIKVATARRDAPEALQGIHADNVLIIGDEASGIDDTLFPYMAGNMSTPNARWILISNSTREDGFFYQCFNASNSHLWYTLKVTAFESSRVSSTHIDFIRDFYGEDSNEYRVGILADFPTSGSDKILPLYRLEQCINTDWQPDNHNIVWGYDVASMGADSNALCKRHGRVFPEPVLTWSKTSPMENVDRVASEYAKATYKPSRIVVDSIGEGSGVYSRLQQVLPGIVVPCDVRKTARNTKLYSRTRDELWFTAQNFVFAGNCKLYNDLELFKDLSSVSSELNRTTGKREIGDKHAGGRSPDRGDAFVMTFFGEHGMRDFTGGFEAPLTARHTTAQYAAMHASYAPQLPYHNTPGIQHDNTPSYLRR